MPTARALEQFLSRQGADYDMLAHPPTMSSMQTAQACHISGDCLAKAVVLKDAGGYLMAVLPASHHLEMQALEERLDRPLALAGEEELQPLFPDCEPGAIPPLGAAYGLDCIIDDSIAQQPDVYFEGGDHATLVRMSGRSFERMFAAAPHGAFSRHD